MMRCVSAGHYFHRLGESFPSIEARVNAVTRERYRRIDRFVQLSLLGAAECVHGRKLDASCALYLSSGVGPIGSNVLVQDAIHRDSRLPMPFNFVNTLGSSACYHVVKELNLTGEAVMVARGQASFTAALISAHADMQSGVTNQILIGAVEECVLPADRHRSLLRLDAKSAVAEGSHWLLLERDSREGTPVAESLLRDAEFDGYESRDAALITSLVSSHPETQFGIRVDGPESVALVTL